jgi:hypothetical protein
MKRTLLLACSAALVLTTASAWAGQHGGRRSASASTNTRARSTITRGGNAGITRQAVTSRNFNRSSNFTRSRNFNRSSNLTRSRNWNGNRNFSNNNWRRHHHHHGNRIIFIGSFGYPYWGSAYPYYWYPYSYSYYPYEYDDYGYGGSQSGYDYGYNSNGGGSIVIEVQRQLSRDGFYQGAIDGVMGSRTHYAVRAYERSHGLAADGEIDDQLLGKMGLR